MRLTGIKSKYYGYHVRTSRGLLDEQNAGIGEEGRRAVVDLISPEVALELLLILFSQLVSGSIGTN